MRALARTHAHGYCVGLLTPAKLAGQLAVRSTLRITRRVLEGRCRHIQAAPQIPRGNAAIRHPLAGMPVHRYRCWQALVTIGTLDGLADAEIVHGEDIEPTERKN